MKIEEFKKMVEENKDNFQFCFNSIKGLSETKAKTKVSSSRFYKTERKRVLPAAKDICRLY